MHQHKIGLSQDESLPHACGGNPAQSPPDFHPKDRGNDESGEFGDNLCGRPCRILLPWRAPRLLHELCTIGNGLFATMAFSAAVASNPELNLDAAADRWGDNAISTRCKFIRCAPAQPVGDRTHLIFETPTAPLSCNKALRRFAHTTLSGLQSRWQCHSPHHLQQIRLAKSHGIEYIACMEAPSSLVGLPDFKSGVRA